MDLIYIVLLVGIILGFFAYFRGRKIAISQHTSEEQRGDIKPELHDAESEHYP
jgi:hypothetical protein